jgi:hypothetical protein
VAVQSAISAVPPPWRLGFMQLTWCLARSERDECPEKPPPP